MPTPIERQSLTKTLDQRYITQRVGGTFDVKSVLKSPSSSPAAGTIINATSNQSQEFQSPNGFEVKVSPGDSQMKDAQGSFSKQLSRYIKGFSNRRYK